MRRSFQKGFTLVELAIVLVILGLLAGGILVGQDLIQAANTRNAIAQIGTYNTATNAFNSRYNGIPGDLRNVGNIFTGITNANGGNGQGDADGLVEGISAAGTVCTTNTCLTGESAGFFFSLARAGMISDPIAAAVDYTAVTAAPVAVSALYPNSGFGGGVKITPHAFSGRNYFVLSLQPTAALAAGSGTHAAGLSVANASNLDSKLDDGSANSGTVLSIAAGATTVANTAGGGVAVPVATTCFDSDDGSYAILAATNGGNNINCALGIRGSF
ncbi:MAG: prepilin-type N-terminal cleavage/methylation domain-containing protein [Alphaproteobacteria bacterium]